jgi:hypothetical protein
MYWFKYSEYCDALDIEEGFVPIDRNQIKFQKERKKKTHNLPLPSTVTRMMQYYYTKKEYHEALEIFNLYFPHFEFEKEAYELATEINYQLSNFDDAQYILYCMTSLEYPAEPKLLEKIKAYRKSKSTRKQPSFSYERAEFAF